MEFFKNSKKSNRVLLINLSQSKKETIEDFLPELSFETVFSLEEIDKSARNINSFSLVIIRLDDNEKFKNEITEWVNRVFAQFDPPIVFFANPSEIAVKIKYLKDSDAFDFIAADAHPMEVRSRLFKAIGYLSKKVLQNDQELTYGPFRISTSQFSLTYKNKTENKLIQLTPLEFRLFNFLIKHEGQVVLREDILQNVWGEKLNVVPRSIDKHIHNLKSKIVSCKATIDSVHGKGYRLSVFDQAETRNMAMA